MRCAMYFCLRLGIHQFMKDHLKITQYQLIEVLNGKLKALDGEVMIPYEECKDMSESEIEEKYHVSKAFAKYYKKNLKKGSDAYEGKEKTHW